MDFTLLPVNRRRFLGTAALLGAAGFAAPVLGAPMPADIGQVKNGEVTFPEIKGAADKPSSKPPAPWPMDKRIGVAVVGLGRLSLEEILPALAECKYARLAALVSGTPDKAQATARQYGVKPEAIYSYENFDSIASNKDVQMVYIVLPNNMHREYTERAAKAGKHVLCEKPMATNVADAKAMVTACAQANVRLMIAYRCQFEPYNLDLIKRARDGSLGKMRFIEATNTQSQGEPKQWRLKKALAGGGALPDIGIYCLNAARYVSGEEPVEVFAQMFTPPGDPRFTEVEERMSFLLRFPSGVMASCNTSYDAHDTKKLSVRLEKGWMELDGAFAYHGKTFTISQREGDLIERAKVEVGEKNQFALEIDHMAECIANKTPPRTPGEEGVKDMVIIEALYKSAATKAPVMLAAPRVTA